MNKNSVVLKGNKYGIVVILDEKAEFDDIKQVIGDKFKESSKFFGNGSMAITFEGKKLRPDEQMELVGIINESSDVNVV